MNVTLNLDSEVEKLLLSLARVNDFETLQGGV